MGLRFEWDDRKASANRRKHQVDFEEAATVLGDRLSITVPDSAHSRKGDQRWITVGMSRNRRLTVVIHSDQGDSVRIISARHATRKEQRNYEEER